MANYKGRGALDNPPGRYLQHRTESVDDGWYHEELPASIATQVRPEPARTIITRNDSPDIPFEQSINPYRGCEHGCVYCLGAGTPILMADGTTRPIADIRSGDAIYGTARRGWYRRYVKTRVRAHWSVVKPGYQIELEDGTTIVAGADHRFLTQRGWQFVTGVERDKQRRAHLSTASRLMGTGAFAQAPRKDADYRRGYLRGLMRGNGLLTLALCDEAALHRAQEFLQSAQIGTERFAMRAASGHRPMAAIRTPSGRNGDQVRQLLAWPAAACRSWYAGFLAGIFDAEGSYTGDALRILSTEAEIIGWTGESLTALGFRFCIEHAHGVQAQPIDVVRVLGGLSEHLRLFHSTDPAIARKRDITNQAVKSAARLGVASIKPLGGAMRLYDITTESEDFIANGFVSHNCYARPSHAYMDLSPGIDFETKIFYKRDAAALLEAELGAPGYTPKPITIGANTDPYQPLERELKVTRSLLEVLERTHHPLTLITKSSLILRDLDLLSALAQRELVQVHVSITSLEAELKRTLEPRTASPQARLRVVQALSAAGVPTGVLVAPIIPAVNDSEIERIIAAVAAAGAMRAGYVLLRLPHELRELFQQWLQEHLPDRAEHVMSLVRAARGGRDNDPRFGSRMVGSGAWAQLLRDRFVLACKRHGLPSARMPALATDRFRPPARGGQLSLSL